MDFLIHDFNKESKGDSDFRISDLSETLMELIFNPCGKFRPSWQNPLSSPPPWCFWDLLRSSKICSDAKERVVCGKKRGSYRTYSSLVKLQRWFLSLRCKTLLWAQLQLWCLSLQ